MSKLEGIRKWLKEPRIKVAKRRRRKPLHPKEREWFAKEQMEENWLKEYNSKTLNMEKPPIRA